ncbi:hypothetical protein LCW_07765 [Latilactobacillus curvatus]|uniref:hypothetical protein n=1 Tax=Latilactobacillus curvatus TaxID=28038 RepID=UPI00084A1DCD|nr:hypothetical protein [Latilactobacillus curvatus]AOO75954.1 hypothetical protein LCW_07765 [Latilactobacillus curvatus]
MKKWYLFNDDGDYLFNFTMSDEKPVNGTDVDPGNKVNPRWTGSDWIEGAVLEPTPIAPTEVDKLKLMVGNLVSENAKKDQSIKQLQAMTGSLVAQIAELNKGGK